MDDFAEVYINKGVLVGCWFFQQNRNVILPIASRNSLTVNAFYEHPLVSALHHPEILEFVFERNPPHHLAPFRFHFFGHLVGHGGGFCPCAHRIFEGVDVAEADFSRKIATFLEGLFRFARETHDDVGGEVEVGAEGLDALAHFAELGGAVMPIHAFQCVVGAALQADVHVRSQFLMLEKAQKAVAELVRLDGRNAHAEVAVDFQNVFHKLLEISVFVLVTPHVYARQHDFLEAVKDHFAHIVIDVLSGTAHRPAAHHRDDAVGAEVVAAVVYLDEAAGVEGVEGRLVTEQVTVVAIGVAVPVFEMIVDDVKQGGFALIVNDIVRNARLQQFLFPMVDHAARDDHQRLWMFPPNLVDGLTAFLVAGIGDGAGVHDENIRRAIAIGNLVSRRLEPRSQGIGFIQIDAATEGFEGDFFHFSMVNHTCSLTLQRHALAFLQGLFYSFLVHISIIDGKITNFSCFGQPCQILRQLSLDNSEAEATFTFTYPPIYVFCSALMCNLIQKRAKTSNFYKFLLDYLVKDNHSISSPFNRHRRSRNDPIALEGDL